jgi:hypothetical protein
MRTLSKYLNYLLPAPGGLTCQGVGCSCCVQVGEADDKGCLQGGQVLSLSQGQGAVHCRWGQGSRSKPERSVEHRRPRSETDRGHGMQGGGEGGTAGASQRCC